MGEAVRLAARIAACLLLAAAPGKAGGEPSPAVATARPNLVLVLIDTLRADRLGSYGYPREVSPELDALAERGVRFARVVSQNTWTRPSVGSLLTSLHPRSIGLYREHREMLAEHHLTLPEVLQQHGYTTLGATANPNLNTYFNFDQGFDHYVDSHVVFEGMPLGPKQVRDSREAPLPGARKMLVSLLDAVRERSTPPYYLQVVLMEVHESGRHPRLLSPDVRQMYPEIEDLRSRRYVQGVRMLSREIDLFLRSLLRLPGWRDTLVVVTSDHGETLLDHPTLAEPKIHGSLVYESHARVPLILHDSAGRLRAGQVVERPVRLLDLAPTLLDYAGIEVPESMAGRSLMPLLGETPGEVALPELFVVETRFRETEKLGSYGGDWLYVENRDGHGGTRPRELQKLGEPADGLRTDHSERHPELLRRRAEALERWEAEHPRVPPLLAAEEASGETVEQLRALGYLP